jgi:hypothetical protein
VGRRTVALVQADDEARLLLDFLRHVDGRGVVVVVWLVSSKRYATGPCARLELCAKRRPSALLTQLTTFSRSTRRLEHHFTKDCAYRQLRAKT